MKEILIKPIGIIETPFKEPEDFKVPPFHPDSPYNNPNVTGILHIDEEYVEGIKDIEANSYAMILFHFHMSPGYTITTRTHGTDKKVGVFSTRSPHRPNGIGSSIIKIISIDGNEIVFSGVDTLNGTPLLDIKPYSKNVDK